MILDYPAGAQSCHRHPYKRDAEGDGEEVIAVIKWGGGLHENYTVEMKKRE